MKTNKRRFILIGAVGLIAVIAIFLLIRASNGSRDAHYVTAQAKYADINSAIQETGTINPVDQVNVGTQVSGTISQLFVDYNSIVHKGEVLARLDPTSFQASADQANATLAQARAQAAAQVSTIAQNAANAQNMVANQQQLEANVKKAQAQYNLSVITVQRDHQLVSQGYIAQSQLDTDVATEQSNLQALRAAEQQAKGGTAQVVGANATEQVSESQAAAAQAQIGVAAAQAEQANYNLSRTVITSPIDGIVVSRNVSVGQTVAASLQTPTLFVIASSLKDMEVDVAVDEADVGQLREGQTAIITVPAYPNVEFKGTVKQVRVNPTTLQNVVTYDAVVEVHDELERLKPGMTANITINVVHRPNVLTVPLAALLYHPATQQKSSSPQASSAQTSASQTSSSQTSSSQTSTSQTQVAGAPGSHVTIWTLQGRQPVPEQIVIGYSDGSNVEVTTGNLQSGERVITSEIRGTQTRAAGGFGPGFGGGRGG